MTGKRWVNAGVLLAAAVFGIPGIWAFGWPRSFFENVALFEPFNLHLFHDLGAFQLGIAAGLLAALVWSDALLVTLFGASVGAIIHAISHVMDRDLGGRAADPWLLTGLAIVFTAVMLARLRMLNRPHDGEEASETADDAQR